jgi:hypothetical protein
VECQILHGLNWDHPPAEICLDLPHPIYLLGHHLVAVAVDLDPQTFLREDLVLQMEGLVHWCWVGVESSFYNCINNYSSWLMSKKRELEHLVCGVHRSFKRSSTAQPRGELGARHGGVLKTRRGQLGLS